MSHTHFCDVAGHPWQCESSECICICQVQMEQGDHNRCPIELRACSQHDNEQFSVVHREERTPSGLHEADASGPPATRTEQEGWVRLKPIPPEINQKLGEWAASERESIGFCCLCGNRIPTEGDLIPDTNTHDCAEGRLFEEKIRRGEL
jgi:hypothetical protein